MAHPSDKRSRNPFLSFQIVPGHELRRRRLVPRRLGIPEQVGGLELSRAQLCPLLVKGAFDELYRPFNVLGDKLVLLRHWLGLRRDYPVVVSYCLLCHADRIIDIILTDAVKLFYLGLVEVWVQHNGPVLAVQTTEATALDLVRHAVAEHGTPTVRPPLA